MLFPTGGGSEKSFQMKFAVVNGEQTDFAYLLRIIKLGGSEKSLIKVNRESRLFQSAVRLSGCHFST